MCLIGHSKFTQVFVLIDIQALWESTSTVVHESLQTKTKALERKWWWICSLPQTKVSFLEDEKFFSLCRPWPTTKTIGFMILPQETIPKVAEHHFKRQKSTAVNVLAAIVANVWKSLVLFTDEALIAELISKWRNMRCSGGQLHMEVVMFSNLTQNWCKKQCFAIFDKRFYLPSSPDRRGKFPVYLTQVCPTSKEILWCRCIIWAKRRDYGLKWKNYYLFNQD